MKKQMINKVLKFAVKNAFEEGYHLGKIDILQSLRKTMQSQQMEVINIDMISFMEDHIKSKENDR